MTSTVEGEKEGGREPEGGGGKREEDKKQRWVAVRETWARLGRRRLVVIGN